MIARPCRALLLATLLAASPLALAWGDLGHEVVADVALHYLDDPTRGRLQELLGKDYSALLASTDAATEATWADRYRDSQRGAPSPNRYDQTHAWHYANVELGGDPARGLAVSCNHFAPLPPGRAASVGPEDDCVVDKIEQFVAELRDPATPTTERVMAAQFLLHLVGDLHQPLHVADDNDEGGNQKRIKGPGLHTGSLHHHWDTTFVEALGDDPGKIAESLCTSIGADQIHQWRKGSARDWALEAYQLAERDAYHLPAPELARTRMVYEVDQAYIDTAEADVRLQLSRAGVRLAWMLQGALQR